MAEPLPHEDQSPASGFQIEQEGTELMTLVLGAIQPADLASISAVSLDVYAADKTALDLITDQLEGALGLVLDTLTLYTWDDTGTAWDEVGPLRGPTGAAGAKGDEGEQGLQGLQGLPGDEGDPGTDGKTILSGEVDPTDEGVDGDFYLNTATSTIFGPKATTWPDGVLLKGADGADGVDGTNGTNGVDGAATTLAEMTDVDLTGATDGQALVYDDADDTWKPGTVAAEGGAGTKTLAVFTWAESQPPATAFATLDTRNSIAVLDFDDTATEATTFVSIIPEGADLTSGILCRIHWTATTATTGNVRWGVQFENMNTDLDADSYDTAALATGTTDETCGKKTITEITITTIDSLAAGDLFRLRVYRNSADTATDTMTGDAELIAVELRGVA